MSPKRPPAWLRPVSAPFKLDLAKDRMLWWRRHQPDLWETISPALRPAVEEYEQAKRKALSLPDAPLDGVA